MQLKDIPRLRTKRDDDGQVIAVARRMPYKPDHLFEDTGAENRFGVYWSRETRRAANAAERVYRRFLDAAGVAVDGEQIGDFDGILYFRAVDPEAIPPWFKRSAAQIAAGERLAATPEAQQARFVPGDTRVARVIVARAGLLDDSQVTQEPTEGISAPEPTLDASNFNPSDERTSP